MRSILGCRRKEWACLLAVGAAEGIITMWKNDVMQVTSSCYGSFQFLSDLLKLACRMNDLWLVCMAHVEMNVEVIFGRKLMGQQIGWSAWVGTSNTIRFTAERSGVSPGDKFSRRFNQWIEDDYLRDSKLVGSPFTWVQVRRSNLLQ